MAAREHLEFVHLHVLEERGHGRSTRERTVSVDPGRRGLQAKKGRLSDQLDQIAFTSRHYGVSLIEMTQRITSLSTSVRSQLDALIMFREENPLERQNLFRNFGFGENKKEWFRVVDNKTAEKYSVIGIRNDAGHFRFFDLNGSQQEEEEKKCSSPLPS